MKLRYLGNTGVRISELCLGAMNFGVPDWGVGEQESLEVIHAYLDAGGNFMDTADVYGGGASEEICGRALRDRRDRVILATKGHFPLTARFVNEHNLAIAEAVKSVAAEHETSSTAVALARVLGRPAVSSVIIGPKSIAQPKGNLAACDLRLSEPSLKRLDEVSRPTPTYPEWFIAQAPRGSGESAG